MALVRFYLGIDYNTPKDVLTSPWWKFWKREYAKEYDMYGFYRAWAQLEFALLFDGKISKNKIVKG